MGWERLDNPKPNASSIGRNVVRVAARSAMKGSRFITVKIGAHAAALGSFSRPEHKCHIMMGKGEEKGQLAIALDDSGGQFTAKRKKCGRYEITVTARAADGRFNMEFPPFEREAKMVPMGSGPSIITVTAGADFLKV